MKVRDSFPFYLVLQLCSSVEYQRRINARLATMCEEFRREAAEARGETIDDELPTAA